MTYLSFHFTQTQPDFGSINLLPQVTKFRRLDRQQAVNQNFVMNRCPNFVIRFVS